MSTEEQDASAEPEEEVQEDDPPMLNKQTLAILARVTPSRMQKLLALIPDDEEDERPVLEALQRISTTFKGNFADFILKDSLYKEFMDGAPSMPEEFPQPTIAPVKQIVQRDAEDLRQMDETLAEIARSLFASIAYLVDALHETTEVSDEVFTEGLFRSLCLTGDALTKLQVERMMHPKMRTRISELTDSSQVPSIVKKVRKESGFFRPKAGESKAPSRDSNSDGDDEETDPPLRKKKRDHRRYKQRSFRPPRYTRRGGKQPYGGGRYFKGNRKYSAPRAADGGSRPPGP